MPRIRQDPLRANIMHCYVLYFTLKTAEFAATVFGGRRTNTTQIFNIQDTCATLVG